jgi:hypothetical protein
LEQLLNSDRQQMSLCLLLVANTTAMIMRTSGCPFMLC